MYLALPPADFRTARVGIKTALDLTSRNAAFMLERTSLDKYFDVIVDGCKVTASKPDPAVFLTAASLLGELPGNCLVIEDAVSGIQAARAAGMQAIGVGDPAVLADADLIVHDLSTLTPDAIYKLYPDTSPKNNVFV